jgi:solute carrier family 9 (sodium/hydrogen exchanger), member 8
LDATQKEMALVILLNYMVYLSAEMIGLSGIMALFVSGVSMRLYVAPNLSQESQASTHALFETIGYLAEAFVFTYLGFSIIYLKYENFYLSFTVGMFLLTALARFISIFALKLILLLIRRNDAIEFREILMIWYGGLIKGKNCKIGAVAFALCLNVQGEHSEIIVTTTTMIVFFSVIAFSGLMTPFASFLKL